jgi:hypothetical protein
LTTDGGNEAGVVTRALFENALAWARSSGCSLVRFWKTDAETLTLMHDQDYIRRSDHGVLYLVSSEAAPSCSPAAALCVPPHQTRFDPDQCQSPVDTYKF